MKSKKITVTILTGIVVGAFLLGMNLYQKRVQFAQMEKVNSSAMRMERFHSTSLGPKDAPVTIVEFFDPGCETCRDFYPIVKDLLAKYPKDVRLVLRYAPLHAGSDKVIKLLEASKKQDKYWQTLEAVLAAQPSWASHDSPNLEAAYQAAARVGLNINQALVDAQNSEVEAVLKQDIEDLTALEVRKTPTFFVNGKVLPSFGREQLETLVADEVNKGKKSNLGKQ